MGENIELARQGGADEALDTIRIDVKCGTAHVARWWRIFYSSKRLTDAMRRLSPYPPVVHDVDVHIMPLPISPFASHNKVIYRCQPAE